MAVPIHTRHGFSMSFSIACDSACWELASHVTYVTLYLEVSPEDFRALAEFASLRRLQINDVQLDRANLDALARLTALEALDLSGCQLPEDLRPLAQLGNLKSLQLRNAGVPEAAIAELQEGLPRLEVLDD